MKPASLLFDTSVYITYRHLLQTTPKPGWFSAVVFQELLAGAEDRAGLGLWRVTVEPYRRSRRLLVPDLLAWETAGVVLHRLLTREKNKTGKRPAWNNDKKQSLIRDVLIAVSAKQHKLTVISDNKDFPLVQQVYQFDWHKAADFFA